MTPLRASALLALALVAAVLLLRGGDDDEFAVWLVLSNAAGLSEGSAVTVGGVRVGEVRRLDLAKDDRVVAELRLSSRTRLRRGVSAAVQSANLLGQKQVALQPGEGAPLPAGARIPGSRVTVPTDLDQVLNALDPDTRARLAVLLNEMGVAFAGRRAELVQLLRELPPSLQDATTLLDAVRADNGTLSRLMTRGDRFITQVTRERRQLSRLVSAAGRAATSVAPERAALRETLRRAPKTLDTVQRFLAELRRTTVPLGPAAAHLRRTAPELRETLEQVEPFRIAAAPTLREATAVAPHLTALAETTPTLRRARPTIGRAAEFADALRPVSSTLMRSADNVVSVFEDWSRAVQFRDGISHLFRGEATVTPETLRSLVGRLTEPGSRTRNRSRSRPGRPAARSPQTGGPRRPPAVRPNRDALDRLRDALPPLVGRSLDALDALDDAIDPLRRRPAPGADGEGAPAANPLLDFLLGR